MQISGWYRIVNVCAVAGLAFGSLTLAIDIANKKAAIPGSGDVPVVFTYSFDVGRFVAALLPAAQPSSWDEESYMIGDKRTLKEVLAIAEDVMGSKLETTYDSLETLRSGRVTELPAQAAVYPYLSKPALQGMCAVFGRLFEGSFDFEPGSP